LQSLSLQIHTAPKDLRLLATSLFRPNPLFIMQKNNLRRNYRNGSQLLSDLARSHGSEDNHCYGWELESAVSMHWVGELVREVRPDFCSSDFLIGDLPRFTLQPAEVFVDDREVLKCLRN
jgi:hypothetical protein